MAMEGRQISVSGSSRGGGQQFQVMAGDCGLQRPSVMSADLRMSRDRSLYIRRPWVPVVLTVASRGNTYIRTSSLCSQISSMEIRNVKHSGLSLQRQRYITCFLPRNVGIYRVNSLVTCPICRTRPHQTWSDFYVYLRFFLPRPLS